MYLSCQISEAAEEEEEEEGEAFDRLPTKGEQVAVVVAGDKYQEGRRAANKEWRAYRDATENVARALRNISDMSHALLPPVDLPRGADAAKPIVRVGKHCTVDPTSFTTVELRACSVAPWVSFV